MVKPPPRADVSTWHPPGVSPLEIWDASVEGRTLFERRDDPDFYDALLHAIPPEPSPVALVGGGLSKVRAARAFRSARRPLLFADDDPFFAARGAFDDAATIVVDAGQTSVKAIGPRGGARIERAGRDALAALVAAAVDEVCEAASRVGLVLAVPCEVACTAGASTLGACSYPIEGDALVLVAAIEAQARTCLRSVRLVNDAVLAAHVARCRLPSRTNALVLTIGHGVGAAILAADG